MNVCGIGIDPSWLAAGAELFGAKVVDCAEAERAPRGVITFLGSPTDQALDATVRAPSIFTYVLNDDFDISALRAPHSLFDAPNLIKGFCISARSAYDLALSTILSEALVANGHLNEARRLDVEIAISEAVANAVIHGSFNLETPEERFDPVFVNAIEACATDPRYGSLPIWITVRKDDDGSLVISVANEGPGFTPGPDPDLNDPLVACRGQGLIHAATRRGVTYLDDGRCLEMKFSL